MKIWNCTNEERDSRKRAGWLPVWMCYTNSGRPVPYRIRYGWIRPLKGQPMTRRNLLRLLFAVPATKLLGAGVPGFGAVTPFDNRRGLILHAVQITVSGASAVISLVVDGKPLSSFVHCGWGDHLIVEHHLAMPPTRPDPAVQVTVEALSEKPFTLFGVWVLGGRGERKSISESNGQPLGLWARSIDEDGVLDLTGPSGGAERWLG